MRDSFDREIRYLRVSVTDRCNLRCVYCMPAEGVPWLPHQAIASFETIRDTVAAAIGLGFDKVRLTGGEPLLRRGILELVSMLRALDGLATLAMSTNGTLLAPLAAELSARGLDSVNVSLDTLDPDRYAELSRGGVLEEALAGIEAARAVGLAVKLNVVVMPDSDAAELEALKAYAQRIGAGIQTIARYRLDAAKDEGHAYDRPPPCAACDRIRLLANGVLRPCLRSAQDLSLDPADPAASIERCVREKPLYGERCADRFIGQIGG